MATIHVGPLQDHLEAEQIASIVVALEDIEIRDPKVSGTSSSSESVEEETLAELLDQLDANDAKCDVYLPIDFEDTFEAAGLRVGATSQLLMVLEELASELFEGGVGEEEDFGDYEDEDEMHAEMLSDFEPGENLKEEQIRGSWEALRNAALASDAENLAVFVKF